MGRPIVDGPFLLASIARMQTDRPALRVAYLTAGAGGMYCGSCLRDNALAAALIRQGRDVSLIPLYSPIRTDEDNVSVDRVYYGGINVFLQQKSALFRKLPRFIERLLDAPALLQAAMRRTGSTSPELLGDLTISILKGEHGAQNKELEKLIDALAGLRPDIVHLPNAMFLGLAARLKKRLGAAIVCTLTGEDIFIDKLLPADRAEAVRLIREGAQHVDAFICVTQYYADACREQFSIPPEKLHMVPLGIRVDELPPADLRAGDPFVLGYLARICSEKGLHAAFDAWEILRREGRDVRLRVAGYLGESDRPYFEEIKQRVTGQGLADHFEYVGEVDRAGKAAFLRSLHAFTVPAVYREAKGLYVLEAMSHGVLVVQPRHGSFPELIEATGGGLLAEPGDAADLALQIARLMDDRELGRRLGAAGHSAVRAKFTDVIMAERAWEVFVNAARMHPATHVART
jgi:glycosyltransferase involved in cell wall biosynthesis